MVVALFGVVVSHAHVYIYKVAFLFLSGRFIHNNYVNNITCWRVSATSSTVLPTTLYTYIYIYVYWQRALFVCCEMQTVQRKKCYILYKHVQHIHAHMYICLLLLLVGWLAMVGTRAALITLA